MKEIIWSYGFNTAYATKVPPIVKKAHSETTVSNKEIFYFPHSFFFLELMSVHSIIYRLLTSGCGYKFES